MLVLLVTSVVASTSVAPSMAPTAAPFDFGSTVSSAEGAEEPQWGYWALAAGLVLVGGIAIGCSKKGKHRGVTEAPPLGRGLSRQSTLVCDLEEPAPTRRSLVLDLDEGPRGSVSSLVHDLPD